MQRFEKFAHGTDPAARSGNASAAGANTNADTTPGGNAAASSGASTTTTAAAAPSPDLHRDI